MRYHTQPNEDEEEALLNMSIVGDEEEKHRIELEQNLQDLSIQLSLSTPSQNDAADSSAELEFPRHAPPPRDVSVYQGHNSLADITTFGPDFDPNAYQDDTSHYGANTLSTAAHHASAVTLSAGLGARSGRRHYATDASLSGAEYDPDRPLDTVVNGMADELSLLNLKPGPGTKKNKKKLDSARPSKKLGTSPRKPTRPQFTRTAPQSNRVDRESQLEQTRARSRPEPQINTTDYTFTDAHATAGGNNSNITGGSKFTRLAKTLAKEIEASQRWVQVPEIRPSPKKSIRRDHTSKPKRSSRCASERKTLNEEFEHLESVNLPDVTGLTSAIGSPSRRERGWRSYAGSKEDDRVEVKLIQSLASLQTRLNHLESQNLTSRRRIRELELELETCKLEVKREKMKALEKEEIIVTQQRDFQRWKSDMKHSLHHNSDAEERYQEVMAEKKALEALITTLRSHLARTTSELSLQQDQLNALQSLREIDARGLEQKSTNIEKLQAEIERIGREVETLRGVVEEGLNERKKAKEDAVPANESVTAQGQDWAPSKSARDYQAASLHALGAITSQTEIPSPPPSRPTSPTISQQDKKQKGRGKLRFAFKSSSQAHDRFIGDDELERVSVELEERRSVRSESNDSRTHEAVNPANNLRTSARGATSKKESQRAEETLARKSRFKPPVEMRASKPESGHDRMPCIQSRRLEQLFFSAPEHNEQTCRLCHRRQRPGLAEDDLDFPSFLPPRKRARLSHDDMSRPRRSSSSQREVKTSGSPFSKDRLPPQTVLTRVLGELEDEFSHYKGIYCELAEQYSLMDAVSNVPKRNALAEHLKDIVDTLEQKGDQIASLYDLLSYKDKPRKGRQVEEELR